MRFDRETFFSRYRQVWSKLTQLQVDGLNFLLDKLESDTFSLPQIAYVLATVKRETDSTFQPIKEYRARKGTKLRATQDRYWLSGFYGRGYVMITWEDNYRKFGIADNPDKALEPETAYDILSRGMREGKFTKFKLSDFINARQVDYFNARQVVNGHDWAEEIAENARKFERILKAALIADAISPVSSDPEPANAEARDDGTQTDKPASGATKEPGAKEVKIATMSPTTKTISFSLIGGAVLKFIQELWQSSQQVVVDAGQYALAHLPQVILIVGLAALGIWIYNQSAKRAADRTRQIVELTANPEKNDVIIT